MESDYSNLISLISLLLRFYLIRRVAQTVFILDLSSTLLKRLYDQ